MSHTKLCSSHKQGITSHRQLKLLIFALYLSFTATQIECRQQGLWQHSRLRGGMSSLRQLAEETAPAVPPGIAICALVENPQEDLREWVEYHKNLGVTRFYIMDSNSSKPWGREIADYISSGLVDFFYSSDLATKTRFPELYIYDICLTRFGNFHTWMAFLDPDEYIVLQPKASVTSLPDFLKDYGEHGGLAINMRMFGSSGHKTRPKGGILRNYIKCLPEQHEENRKIKTLVNTALDPALHVHSVNHVNFKDGFFAVDEAKRRVKTGEATTPKVSMEKVAVHKYPLRVAPTWTASPGKDKALEGRAHYEALDREATKDCLAAKRAAQQDSTDKYGMH
ncbi:probable glycosyltransferase family 92 protein RCOM_0530710 [Coccomyxa sp. Obi]|nr:probable glycosyltransferase family 92 protein RCOM_0530710 [Coccomyxa sp. Obi]